MATVYDPATNRNTIASEWKRLGWSDVAIAGMLGRAQRESSFNTSITNPGDANDGTDSKGLFQWNRDRLANLKRFAKENGTKWNDPKTQARFTHWEITEGPEKKTWQRLQNAKTVTQAVNAAMLYTRPQGSIIGKKLSPTTGLHYKETLQAARKFYGKVQPAKDPLEEIQSAWDPSVTNKNQSDWPEAVDGKPLQSDAKIDFATQTMVEDGLKTSQQAIEAGNKELVTPNDGSFNPDLAGALSSILPGVMPQQQTTPAPPSLSELQSLFKPRLSWASL